MAEHTPGPWTWDGINGIDAKEGPGNGGAVADIVDPRDGPLIAAAPDLLVALWECHRIAVEEGKPPTVNLPAFGVFDRIEKVARAALARAEGQRG